MKTLFAFLFASLLVTSAAAADRVVELGHENINIGTLNQERGNGAMSTINVVRTAATPKVVELAYNFQEGQYVCTQWRDRVVYEPGYYRTVCNTDRYGRSYCRRIYVGGYYRTVTECVRRDYRLFNSSRVLKLNFKKAADLNAGEREVFAIDFAQRGLDSGKFDYNASAVESATDYKIKYSSFLRKDTFIFKK